MDCRRNQRRLGSRTLMTRTVGAKGARQHESASQIAVAAMTVDSRAQYSIIKPVILRHLGHMLLAERTVYRLV